MQKKSLPHPNASKKKRAAAEGAALLRKISKMPAQFDKDFVFTVDERLQGPDDGMTRRVALLMLTRPAKQLFSDVKSNRDLAIEIAQVFNHLPEVMDRLNGLISMLKTSEIWMMVALAQRPDVDQVFMEADRQMEVVS